VSFPKTSILTYTCQKYWVGKPKYWGAEGVRSDKCMGVFQLLGARARAAPESLRLWTSVPSMLMIYGDSMPWSLIKNDDLISTFSKRWNRIENVTTCNVLKDDWPLSRPIIYETDLMAAVPMLSWLWASICRLSLQVDWRADSWRLSPNNNTASSFLILGPIVLITQRPINNDY